jgi:hypothetical protein
LKDRAKWTAELERGESLLSDVIQHYGVQDYKHGKICWRNSLKKILKLSDQCPTSDQLSFVRFPVGGNGRGKRNCNFLSNLQQINK